MPTIITPSLPRAGAIFDPLVASAADFAIQFRTILGDLIFATQRVASACALESIHAAEKHRRHQDA
jgi:hypothetical protein